MLCAVLMDQTPNPGKRQVMRQRGPVLLHPGFLAMCKSVLAEAADAAKGPTREDLLTRGLFFVAEERWMAAAAAVASKKPMSCKHCLESDGIGTR